MLVAASATLDGAGYDYARGCRRRAVAALLGSESDRCFYGQEDNWLCGQDGRDPDDVIVLKSTFMELKGAVNEVIGVAEKKGWKGYRALASTPRRSWSDARRPVGRRGRLAPVPAAREGVARYAHQPGRVPQPPRRKWKGRMPQRGSRRRVGRDAPGSEEDTGWIAPARPAAASPAAPRPPHPTNDRQASQARNSAPFQYRA